MRSQLPTDRPYSREQRTFVRDMYLHYVAMDSALSVPEMYAKNDPGGDYSCTYRYCERIDSHDPKFHAPQEGHTD